MKAWMQRWARVWLCPASWHDWQFVLVTTRGQVWAMKRCSRCHRQDLGVPMGERGAWGSPC